MGLPRLLSVNVGLPRDIEWKGRTVRTAIWKDPVQGDGQGDLAGHGGEQRAVFVYQSESYRYWQEQLKRTDFVYGQFGENFTIEGLADDAVCVGDRFQIGSAVFEVTQPRVTCYRVGIRMNEPRMPALLTSSGRPGFYFRVLQEGPSRRSTRSCTPPVTRASGWSVRCGSARYHPAGARRSRHCSRASRPRNQAATPGSCPLRRSIQPRQDSVR
jgi:hypothetical protein